jgi:hypothetical protein
MSKKPKKSDRPAASGNAPVVIGLFDSEDRIIEMDSAGRVTIQRLGKTTVRIHVEEDGSIVISGDAPIFIRPGASNMIRI